MALKTREQTKSLRMCFQNEEGEDILTCNATYGSHGVNVNFETFDKTELIADNKQDIQEAVNGFVRQLNGLLKESDLFLIPNGADDSRGN